MHPGRCWSNALSIPILFDFHCVRYLCPNILCITSVIDVRLYAWAIFYFFSVFSVLAIISFPFCPIILFLCAMYLLKIPLFTSKIPHHPLPRSPIYCYYSLQNLFSLCNFAAIAELLSSYVVYILCLCIWTQPIFPKWIFSITFFSLPMKRTIKRIMISRHHFSVCCSNSSDDGNFFIRKKISSSFCITLPLNWILITLLSKHIHNERIAKNENKTLD